MENAMNLLEKYAELVITVGVNIRKGQGLFIKSGPDTYSFARLAAEAAYRHGAAYVHIDIADQMLAKTRIECQDEQAVSYVPDFITQTHRSLLQEDWAYLRIDNTEDRDALSEAPARRLSAMQGAVRKTLADFYSSLMRHEHAWCVVCAPGPQWAKQVLSDDAVTEDLWKILIPILKLDAEDPQEAWRSFGRLLKERAEYLTSLDIDSLHFSGGETDLTIGLSSQALWIGGGDKLGDGRLFFPNIPTEEVFTVPDFRRVDGVLATTRPVTVLGKQVYGARIEIRGGEAVSWSAEKGEDVLDEFFRIDAGARRLGEIALVDESSPLARSGCSFHSILYDENASCHAAFGAGYPSCLKNHTQLSGEGDLLREGCNTSLTHVDFMIGSPETNLTAKLRNGTSVAVMRRGLFVKD
jgi:aminopeptidase